KELAIVWANGDSMEPTIHNNDTLVVHMGRNKPQDGHIYIFRNEDQLFVKRYQNILGAWRLISDNKIYDKVDIKKEDQHQFEVVGQVVHIAKDIGD
ncbi:S24 family peptidase, partial [Vibrio vulnificus]|uniref:S24 family peptidase n=1 Tax=Vibrio vulnificus TaxID=672 RepID=UPI004058F8A5